MSLFLRKIHRAQAHSETYTRASGSLQLSKKKIEVGATAGLFTYSFAPGFTDKLAP
ncbi:MAG: hypothetical protein V4615_11975 [Bacteroidota bacterium]